jgi:hypothetical protein
MIGSLTRRQFLRPELPIEHEEFARGLVLTSLGLVFISHCFKEHEESKKNFLREHFSSLVDVSRDDWFVSTHYKSSETFDVIIEDNPCILREFINGKHVILLETSINTGGILDRELKDYKDRIADGEEKPSEIYIVKDWKEVSEALNNLRKGKQCAES